MLSTSNITFRVSNKDLISNISLSFSPGKLHLIIGPNGAGKSTLIKVLARLLRPQIGSLHYDGVDVSVASEAELAKRRAVLSQAVEVAFPLTVREVVLMGRYPHFGGRPGPTDQKIVDEVMGEFDVTEFSDRIKRSVAENVNELTSRVCWLNCGVMVSLIRVVTYSLMSHLHSSTFGIRSSS